MRVLSATTLACTLFAAAPAAAWTDAAVRSMRVNLETTRSGASHGSFELDVEIHGGWLSELDVPPLGENVRLDPWKPAWAVLPDGQKLTPDVVVLADGTVRFRFSRREAPKRGHVTLGGTVDLELASDGRLAWTPPAWQHGLDGASVRWTVPADLRFVADEATEVGGTTRVMQAGDAQVMESSRAHLPRGAAWTFAFEAPETDAPTASATSYAPDSSRWPYLALFLFVVLLGALRHVLSRPTTRLLRLPKAALLLSAAGLAGASLTLDVLQATLFVASLGLASLAFADPVRPRPLFDGSKPLGFATWLSLGALAAAYGESATSAHLRVAAWSVVLVLVPLFFARPQATFRPSAVPAP